MGCFTQNYKHMKEYLGSSGAGEWCGLSKEQKKEVSRVGKLPLEFTQAMYVACEPWVGRMMIFSTTMNLQDSDRRAPILPPRFGRAPSSTPRAPMSTPPFPRAASSSGTMSESQGGVPTPSQPPSPQGGGMGPPSPSTPGDGTPGSTGCKRRQCGADNLVDFVKDFNHDYLVRVEMQENEKKVHRTNILDFEKEREVRIITKETSDTCLERQLYELEVQKTASMVQMTQVLFMMASSMEALTRGMVSGGGGGLQGSRSGGGRGRGNDVAGMSQSGARGLHGEGTSGRGWEDDVGEEGSE